MTLNDSRLANKVSRLSFKAFLCVLFKRYQPLRYHIEEQVNDTQVGDESVALCEYLIVPLWRFRELGKCFGFGICYTKVATRRSKKHHRIGRVGYCAFDVAMNFVALTCTRPQQHRHGKE